MAAIDNESGIAGSLSTAGTTCRWIRFHWSCHLRNLTTSSSNRAGTEWLQGLCVTLQIHAIMSEHDMAPPLRGSSGLQCHAVWQEGIAHLVLQLRLALGLGGAASPRAQDNLPEHWQKPEGLKARRPLGCDMTEQCPVLHPLLQTLQSRQLDLRSIGASVRGKAHIVSHFIVLSIHPSYLPSSKAFVVPLNEFQRMCTGCVETAGTADGAA